jgi:hypothetical protein
MSNFSRTYALGALVTLFGFAGKAADTPMPAPNPPGDTPVPVLYNPPNASSVTAVMNNAAWNDNNPKTDTEKFDYKIAYGNGDDAIVAAQNGRFVLAASWGSDSKYTKEQYARYIGEQIFSGKAEIPVTIMFDHDSPGKGIASMVLIDGHSRETPDGKLVLLFDDLKSNAQNFADIYNDVNGVAPATPSPTAPVLR